MLLYLIPGLAEFLFRLGLGLFPATICPRCGHRLKYARQYGPDVLQCVMCERLWRQRKGGGLYAIEKDEWRATQYSER
jgi:hypothetical protein